jgi:2-hydroxychromene-2-carboxylate isomerase
MVTETMIVEPIIKKAMEKIGLKDKAKALLEALDEIKDNAFKEIGEAMQNGTYKPWENSIFR